MTRPEQFQSQAWAHSPHHRGVFALLSTPSGEEKVVRAIGQIATETGILRREATIAAASINSKGLAGTAATTSNLNPNPHLLPQQVS